VKQAVQIIITVGETSEGEHLHITANKSYSRDDQGLSQAFSDFCHYLDNYGSDSKTLFDMLDEGVILIDRHQVTAPNKPATIARLNNEYARDHPLKFKPGTPQVSAEQGTVSGVGTWEDNQNLNKPEQLKYEFVFRYVTNAVPNTWLIKLIRSKP
jgi:hypothetical protein